MNKIKAWAAMKATLDGVAQRSRRGAYDAGSYRVHPYGCAYRVVLKHRHGVSICPRDGGGEELAARQRHGARKRGVTRGSRRHE